MRVLLVNRDHALWLGGDAMQVESTQRALHHLGVHIDYSPDLTIDLTPYDVVHLFHLNYCWTATMAQRCREAGIPYVVSCIFYPEVREVSMAEMREVVLHAHATIVNSPIERGQMMALLGVDAEQIHVVPNGIDADLWQRGRRRNGPALTFARVVPAKGLIFAAQACHELGIPLVVFGLAGGYPDYDATLRSLGTRLLGVHRQAVLATAARAASVYLCTSLSDVQSLSVLEAAQCGLPIVDTIHNPGASLLPSSRIVNPRDHHALVQAIVAQRSGPDNTDHVPTWLDVGRQILDCYPPTAD